jgi:hypothetical protein
LQHTAILPKVKPEAFKCLETVIHTEKLGRKTQGTQFFLTLENIYENFTANKPAYSKIQEVKMFALP